MEVITNSEFYNEKYYRYLNCLIHLLKVFTIYCIRYSSSQFTITFIEHKVINCLKFVLKK